MRQAFQYYGIELKPSTCKAAVILTLPKSNVGISNLPIEKNQYLKNSPAKTSSLK